MSCHKCSQCGEASYSGEVVARLEEIVAKLKEALTEVSGDIFKRSNL